jgi:hypothetical protein
LQRIPDCQQTTFPIFPPLMIPESNRFNALLREKLFARFVMLDAFRQAVLNAIKLDRQFCVGTVKVQNATANGVLSAELETGKSASPERAPKLLLLIRLIVAKLPGDLFEAHAGMMMIVKNKFKPLTLPLSPLGRREGIKTNVHRQKCFGYFRASSDFIFG